MLIGIIVGHGASVNMDFVKSLIKVKDYDFIIQEGPNIPVNRNKVFELAKMENEDLLFIDSDMVFTHDDVKAMENHLKSYDVVTGVCVMNAKNYPAAIFKLDADGSYTSIEPKHEIFEVDACGAAFLGISKKVLQLIDEPFTHLINMMSGRQYGEDVSFSIRVREKGCHIMCDPKLNIGHIKSNIKYYPCLN